MRKKTGTISSTAMKGTVSVTVHRHVFHSLYKKRYRKSKKYLADVGDVTDIVVGDTVVITECRPLSKNKHFRVTEVLDRVPRVSEVAEEEGIEKAIHREKEKQEIVRKKTEDSEDSKESDDKESSDSAPDGALPDKEKPKSDSPDEA